MWTWVLISYLAILAVFIEMLHRAPLEPPGVSWG